LTKKKTNKQTGASRSKNGGEGPKTGYNPDRIQKQPLTLKGGKGEEPRDFGHNSRKDPRVKKNQGVVSFGERFGKSRRVVFLPNRKERRIEPDKVGFCWRKDRKGRGLKGLPPKSGGKIRLKWGEKSVMYFRGCKGRPFKRAMREIGGVCQTQGGQKGANGRKRRRWRKMVRKEEGRSNVERKNDHSSSLLNESRGSRPEKDEVRGELVRTAGGKEGVDSE